MSVKESMRKTTAFMIFLAAVLGLAPPSINPISMIRTARAQSLEEVTYNEIMDPNTPLGQIRLVLITTKGEITLDLSNELQRAQGGKDVRECYLNEIWNGQYCNLPIQFSGNDASWLISFARTPEDVVSYRRDVGGVINEVLPGDLALYDDGGGVSTSSLLLIKKQQRSCYYALAQCPSELRGQNYKVLQSLGIGDSLRGCRFERGGVPNQGSSSSQVSSQTNAGSNPGSSGNSGFSGSSSNNRGNFNICGHHYTIYHGGDMGAEFSLYDLLMQDGIYRRDSLHENFDEEKMSRVWTDQGFRNQFGKWMAVQLSSSGHENLDPSQFVLDVNGRKIPPYMPNGLVSGAVMQGPVFWEAIWHWFNPGSGTSLSMSNSSRTFYIPYLLDDESQGGNGRYTSAGLGAFSDGLDPYEVRVQDAIGRIYDADGRVIETSPISQINAASRRMSLR